MLKAEIGVFSDHLPLTLKDEVTKRITDVLNKWARNRRI